MIIQPLISGKLPLACRESSSLRPSAVKKKAAVQTNYLTSGNNQNHGRKKKKVGVRIRQNLRKQITAGIYREKVRIGDRV